MSAPNDRPTQTPPPEQPTTPPGAQPSSSPESAPAPAPTQPAYPTPPSSPSCGSAKRLRRAPWGATHGSSCGSSCASPALAAVLCPGVSDCCPSARLDRRSAVLSGSGAIHPAPDARDHDRDRDNADKHAHAGADRDAHRAHHLPGLAHHRGERHGLEQRSRVRLTSDGLHVIGLFTCFTPPDALADGTVTVTLKPVSGATNKLSGIVFRRMVLATTTSPKSMGWGAGPSTRWSMGLTPASSLPRAAPPSAWGREPVTRSRRRWWEGASPSPPMERRWVAQRTPPSPPG